MTIVRLAHRLTTGAGMIDAIQIRRITPEQAAEILAAEPPEGADLAGLALATGLNLGMLSALHDGNLVGVMRAFARSPQDAAAGADVPHGARRH